MKIYYTLKEYKENYKNELKSFLEDYEDNEEIDFWNEQIELYNNCIKNVSLFRPETSNEYHTLPQLTGENIIDEVHNKIYGSYIETIESKSTDNREMATGFEKFCYDFDLAEKIKRSFNKILNFINEAVIICRITHNIPETNTENSKVTARFIEDIEHSSILEFYNAELSLYFKLNPKGNEIDYVNWTIEKLNNEYAVNSKESNSIDTINEKRRLDQILDYYHTRQKALTQSSNNNIKLTSKITDSLLLEGKKLNLSERYTIANKLLEIDSKIRTLNIKDLEKYQLLAYILGCNKDNARNLMNGQYNSKDRDLNSFFDEIGLNK